MATGTVLDLKVAALEVAEFFLGEARGDLMIARMRGNKTDELEAHKKVNKALVAQLGAVKSLRLWNKEMAR